MAEEKKSFFNKVAGWFAPDEDDIEVDGDYEEVDEDEEVVKPEKPMVKSVKKEMRQTRPEDVKALNIKIIKPGDDKSAVTTILDNLKSGKVVVVNFEETRHDIRASFSDAFFGATYVLNANYSKLSESAYVLAPNNVSVSPLIAEMADNGSEKTSNNKTYFGNF